MIGFMQLLDNIKDRPSLFLGQKSVTLLRPFIDGYLTLHPNQEEIFQFLHDFSLWLLDQHSITLNIAWEQILREKYDDKEGFEQFFLQFEKFVQLASTQDLISRMEAPVDGHKSDCA